MKFRVYGTVQVGVTITVDADNENDAFEKAYEEFDGLRAYVGNGGSDKFIGVSQSNVSLEVDEGEADFTDVDIVS